MGRADGTVAVPALSQSCATPLVPHTQLLVPVLFAQTGPGALTARVQGG
jgi:hypothetical protein